MEPIQIHKRSGGCHLTCTANATCSIIRSDTCPTPTQKENGHLAVTPVLDIHNFIGNLLRQIGNGDRQIKAGTILDD